MSVLREIAHTLHPPAGDRDGPLVPMMVALTLVTGFVDATSYLALGHVFVANMTGNVVFIGFALAGAGSLSAVESLAALGAFLLGALLAARIGASTGAHRARQVRVATGVQLTLMALALALALAGAEHPGTAMRYALLVPLALAMGVQNAAAQRIAVPELTTTVLTKTLTGIATEAGAAGAGTHLGRRVVSVGAMLLGALCGGLLVLHVSIAASLGAACAIVLAVALAAHALSGARAAWAEA